MEKKVTSKTITPLQMVEVNEYFEYSEGDMHMSCQAYAFYFNQMRNGLDPCDADRYANLNTILGYDVGIRKFRALDQYLWNTGFDLMELKGTYSDKQLLQKATLKAKLKPLDFSKWRNLSNQKYEYSFFEKN